MVANTETLRQQNRALILSALREHGALAHIDIAEWTGLSSATVSAITAELISSNIIEKTEVQASKGRGRPRTLFQQNPGAAYVAAIRITSESVECSLADYSGTLKDRFSEPRPQKEIDASSFAARLKANLEKLLRRSDLRRDEIKTISVTSKGLVAEGRPVLLWSPVFGDQQIDFHALLSDTWNARIALTNETQFTAQAIANIKRMDAPVYNSRQSATLSLGHSIGLGLAWEKPGHSIRTNAPAFGHMIHENDGPLCRCGAHGCIEAYAGFYGILRSAFEVPNDTIPANFIPMEEMDKLAGNARHGDRRAEFAFRNAGEVLGIGLSRLISMHGTMSINITGQGLKYLDLMKVELEEPVLNNLQVRFGDAPPISSYGDQANLVYEGNVENCLSDLDTNILNLVSPDEREVCG